MSGWTNPETGAAIPHAQLMADLSRNAAHTDMAFINSGSLRASILPGKVTFGEISSSPRV